ncbi:ubiquitin carboxyl-terminal hydrolase 38-like [Neocloeon triangulifer]|uniref:ubiquitin carboxyl-terminal hydrolase 38-like n=1 Tax=Neocloeon triangulifer TaxID=2078957 RepID=UPI00286F4FAE|nr:ubiquitin carboxyl-terminal hydrolase 38-like [Neocloeon triangulifer]
MTSREPLPEEKMKATLFCLVLRGGTQNCHRDIANFLPQAISKEPTLSRQYFDICVRLLSVDDPEFTWLEEILCNAMRQTAPSVENNVFSTLVQQEGISNQVLVTAVRGKLIPEYATLREVIAKETLQLFRSEDVWTSGMFLPLVVNIGKFESFDNIFVQTVFGVLDGYKLLVQITQNIKDINEKVTKLMELTKKWMHVLPSQVVPRKRIIMNTLYESIVQRRANPSMTNVLMLVEVEILNALLRPIPKENVPLVAKELISWFLNWFYNCRLLLPPIIKLLQRLVDEHMEEDYNQIVSANFNKMVVNARIPMYRPLISIICHFLRNNTCPEAFLEKSSENLKNLLLCCAKEEQIVANLSQGLEVIHKNYPEQRLLIINILRDSSLQPCDLNANFTVNEDPKGLINTGNTCYANSVIQCLFYISSFRNKVLAQKPRGSQTVLTELQKIFALLKFSASTVILPSEHFHAALRPTYFVRGHQEDGFLYLIHILDIMKEQELKAFNIEDDEMEVKREFCHSSASEKSDMSSASVSELSNEANRTDSPENDEVTDDSETTTMSMSPDESVGKTFPCAKPESCEGAESTNNNDLLEDETESECAMPKYNTLGQQVFGGCQFEMYMCHGCNYEHKQTKRTTSICLAIPDRENKHCRISNLLEAYFQPVELQDSEKYECRNCKVKVDSTCFTKLVVPPQYLILCLKRFLYNTSQQQTVKIMTQVQVEDEIQVNGKDFKIHAMVVHSGPSASHGHYYSMISTENGTLKLDDGSVVTNCSTSMGALDTPYILFYRRKDCQEEEPSVAFADLDASLQSYVRNYQGRGYLSSLGSYFKKPQPPPPPPPSSSCGGGSGMSTSRMVF